MRFNTDISWERKSTTREYYGRSFQNHRERAPYEMAPCNVCQHNDSCLSGAKCPAWAKYMRLGRRWRKADRSDPEMIPVRRHT